MQYLSQRDPRWSSVRIGSSFLTVRSFGCTLTCLSMLSDYFVCFLDPGQIAKTVSWFNGLGQVLWGNLQFKHFKPVQRLYSQHDDAIKISLDSVDKAVILQVWNGRHWVLAIRQVHTKYGIDYLCVDPWTGRQCFAKGTYGNITGSEHFERI